RSPGSAVSPIISSRSRSGSDQRRIRVFVALAVVHHPARRSAAPRADGLQSAHHQLTGDKGRGLVRMLGPVNCDGEVSPGRAAYDMRAAALVGRRVLHVRYWDVHNFADEPARWDYGDWHHAVMGVDGRRCPLAWQPGLASSLELRRYARTGQAALGE